MTKRRGRDPVLGLLLSLSILSCSRLPEPAREAALALRVMTFNIRLSTPADGANAWPQRRDIAAGTIAFHRPHIAGLQEVLVSQLRDLETLLPGYSWVGAGRDDGKEAGEYNPIFFLKERFRLLASSTFWLSETPDKPGVKGWDAACARVVTWARLKDRWSGREIVALNTHFDHMGERARRESAALVLAALPGIAGDAPVVLTGDFNCTREDAAYEILAASGGKAPRLRDAREASLQPPYGPPGSFNGFRAESPAGLPIDHIFLSPAFAVLHVGILPAAWAGRFVSDHNPVLAEARLAPR